MAASRSASVGRLYARVGDCKKNGDLSAADALTKRGAVRGTVPTETPFALRTHSLFSFGTGHAVVGCRRGRCWWRD